MQNRLSRQPWLIPGIVAAILFAGQVVSNLVASDLEQFIPSYRRWIWLFFGIAALVTIVTAITATRRKDNSGTAASTHLLNANYRSASVGGDLSDSTVITGDKNVTANRIGGDLVAGPKIVHVHQNSAAPDPTLHQLRAPVGDFVGRAKQIDTLINALRVDDRACIAGISGMGGIGKTELALSVAERLRDDYPDAQLFMNLQGIDPKPRPPQEVLAECIRAFLGPGASLPEDLEQLSKRYRSMLSGKHVLVVLDNASDGAQVRPLLPPTGCALLVTSRQAIALPGMTSLTLYPLEEKEARKLLLEIAPRAEPVAEKICSLCGYLPLAIRAAASLLAVTVDLDPVDYATQLRDERSRLEHIGSEGVEISVEASFNLSYARLVPESSRVFRSLAAFPSTFDALAEEMICADPGHVQLSNLVQRSLVMYDATTKRYRLHDLARLFANLKLTEEEERTHGRQRHAIHPERPAGSPSEKHLTQRRHAEYFLVKAEAIEPRLAGRDFKEYMDWFKVEQDNMRAALSWSLDHDAEIALRLAHSLSSFWNMLGQLNEERTALNRALEKSEGAPPKLRMRVLGRAAARQLDIKFAKKLAKMHWKLSRETGYRDEEAWALQNLGKIARLEGKLGRARKLHQEALQLFEEQSDKRAMAMTYLNLCVVAVDQDDFTSAQMFVTASLKLSEDVANRGDLIVTRTYLAFLLHKQGDYAKCDELMNQNVEMLRTDARQSWLPWGLHWKARIAIDRSEFETARLALTESVGLFQENEDTDGQIRTLLAFSWFNERQGFWERAATLLAAEESQRKQRHSPPAPDWKREIETIKTSSREALGSKHFNAASATGARMTLDQAVAYAVEKQELR